MTAIQRKWNNTDDMAGKTFKRKFHRNKQVIQSPLTWKLCLFITSVPIVALYIGYSVGNYLMPPPRKFPEKDLVVDIGRLNYSWYNTHNITIDFRGGLGNHMFEYASLYGIAKANGLKPYIYIENRLMDFFPALLNAKFITNKNQIESYSSFNEFSPSSFDGRSFSLNFMKNVRLEGFFQSWRYFDHVRADIRKQFRFLPEIQAKVHAATADILKEYKKRVDPKVFQDSKYPVQFVGLHIRRGDTLDQYNIDRGYTVATLEYIKTAMGYFQVTYKNVVFVICTDDEKWARENVETKSTTSLVVLSPFLDTHPTYDLCLLASCNHTIITVGSFGWWGAWLAGGDAVYYKSYPKPFSILSKHFSHSDYYMNKWIPL